MYAIIRTGGKQYRVEPGTKVRVEKLDQKLGSQFEITEVLAVGGDETFIGSPLVEKAKVTVTVTQQAKGPKVLVFKKKRRKRYRRTKGHRQLFTELFVNEIASPSGKTAKADEEAHVIDPSKPKEKKAAKKTATKKTAAKKKTAKKKTKAKKKAASKKTKKKTAKKKTAKKKATKKKTTKKKKSKKSKSKKPTPQHHRIDPYVSIRKMNFIHHERRHKFDYTYRIMVYHYIWTVRVNRYKKYYIYPPIISYERDIPMKWIKRFWYMHFRQSIPRDLNYCPQFGNIKNGKFTGKQLNARRLKKLYEILGIT